MNACVLVSVMDRIWQRAWDRFGARHRWAGLAVVVPAGLPLYLFWSLLIVALEGSRHYVEAAAVTRARSSGSARSHFCSLPSALR